MPGSRSDPLLALLTLFLFSLSLPSSAKAAWYNTSANLVQSCCGLRDFHFWTCLCHRPLQFDGLLWCSMRENQLHTAAQIQYCCLWLKLLRLWWCPMLESADLPRRDNQCFSKEKLHSCFNITIEHPSIHELIVMLLFVWVLFCWRLQAMIPRRFYLPIHPFPYFSTHTTQASNLIKLTSGTKVKVLALQHEI